MNIFPKQLTFFNIVSIIWYRIEDQRSPCHLIMQVKCRQIKKQLEEKGALNPAQQLTYDMVTKGAGAVCPENLQPVIDWSNSVK